MITDVITRPPFSASFRWGSRGFACTSLAAFSVSPINDLNSSDHRVLPQPVIQKRLLRNTLEVVGNQRGCFGNMSQPKLLIRGHELSLHSRRALSTLKNRCEAQRSCLSKCRRETVRCRWILLLKLRRGFENQSKDRIAGMARRDYFYNPKAPKPNCRLRLVKCSQA